MSRKLHETTDFKKDKKRIQGSGRYDWEKMRLVVKELLNDRPLPVSNRDHPLQGMRGDVRECHIESDWLLIYIKQGSLQNGVLKVVRTGTHSELFN